jgi:GDP-L-fucose synthase
MDKNSKIYIAGHKGMVGSAMLRLLEREGYKHVIVRTSAELDLRRQSDTEAFFEREKPDYVVVAAAMVGGIMANNTLRADFLYNNLMIEANIIHAAYLSGVKKLLFLGSSCIYPKMAPQPLKEEYLLSDYLEYTNEPYAIAKIAGIKLCESYFRQYESNFISVMPTNLYGPNDNYDLNTSHVLPALIRKLAPPVPPPAPPERGGDESPFTRHSSLVTRHASRVTLWGSGSPLREFLHVDDLAEACYFLLQNMDAEQLYGMGITHLNIGTGEDLSIKELAEMIAGITGYTGTIEWDTSKPDGTPRKLMDVSRMTALGWKAKIGLREGIERVYSEFKLRG